jgi:hypothetical protein
MQDLEGVNTFRRIQVLYLWGQAVHYLGLLEPEDECITILRNVRNQNYLPVYPGDLTFGQRSGEVAKSRICALVHVRFTICLGIHSVITGGHWADPAA